MGRALLVFSGGLDTTVCVPMLRERGYDPIATVCIDVGQPADDIAAAEKRADALGTDHTTLDAKNEFAQDHCLPAIAANADYDGYPLSTALARPLIARLAAEHANMLDVSAIAHGCTGKGNDQFRIEYGLRMFAPDTPILAPIREGDWTRTAEIEYAEERGLPIGQSREKIWSIDENLWGRSIEGGALEDPATEPPEEIFAWTASPTQAPNQPQTIEIRFEEGRPVALDAKSLDPLSLIAKANEIAGTHGVGRIDMMEDRLIGLKVRENYECPGAALLIRAHRELESLVATVDERRFKALVDAEWARQIYGGLWWDPLTEELNAFITKLQERVTGWVKLRLFKGGMQVVGRHSEFALYDEAAASFDDADAIRQSDMTGMVRMHGRRTPGVSPVPQRTPGVPPVI